MKKRIEEIILNEKMYNKTISKGSIYDVELLGNMACAFSLVKINQLKVLIYGAGNWGKCLYKLLQAKGIEVECFIDIYIKEHGETVPVYSDFSLLDVKEDKYFMFIAIDNLSSDEKEEILKRASGYIEDFFFLESDARTKFIMDCYMRTLSNAKFISYYKSNLNRVLDAFSIFEDTKSKEVFCQYIKSRVCNMSFLENISSKMKYFYDVNINTPFYSISKDETWINVGANTGDTIFNAVEIGVTSKFKNIFAVEGDNVIYQELEKNIRKLPDTRNIFCVNEFIDDSCEELEFIKDNKVGLINADLEGYELSLLRATKNVIKRDRPVLAICVYHKPEDIVEIPDFINDIVQDYCFRLRKYEAGLESILINNVNELVLYAIPKEKMI